MSNKLQTRIMEVVDEWSRHEKQPTPQRHIVIVLTSKEDYTVPTIRAAVKALIRKGYLRKAVTVSNKVSYVQLRSL